MDLSGYRNETARLKYDGILGDLARADWRHGRRAEVRVQARAAHVGQSEASARIPHGMDRSSRRGEIASAHPGWDFRQMRTMCRSTLCMAPPALHPLNVLHPPVAKSSSPARNSSARLHGSPEPNRECRAALRPRVHASACMRHAVSALQRRCIATAERSRDQSRSIQTSSRSWAIRHETGGSS